MNPAWLIPPANLRISSEHIDIWRVQLDRPDDKIDELFQLLDKTEQSRANKYLSTQKAREFIVTRAALRTILAGVLHRQPLDLEFDHDPNGKPWLIEAAASRQINFNVSHSHEIALIGVTSGNQIGIDIEKIRTDIDYDSLSRRFFSEREHEALQKCSEEIRLVAFFATWTRKEAVVKALGKGIAKSLMQFDVSVDPNQAPEILHKAEQPGEISNLFLATINTDDAYYASLATSSTPTGLPHKRYWIFQH